MIADRLVIPAPEFDFRFARSSGPGGQNVNKVNSKATLRWAVASSASLPHAVKRRFLARYASRINAQGVLQITSQRFRDRTRNVTDCLEKLRAMLLAVASPPQRRKRTAPTRSSREKRLRAKRRRAATKGMRSAPSLDP